MKLINKIILATLVLTSALSFGQNKIKVIENRSKVVQLRGADIYAVNKTSDGDLLFLTKKYARYGSINGAGRLTYLSRLNADMKGKKEKQLPVSYLKKRINYVDVKKIGTKYLLFFTFINEKLKKEVMFFVQIDPTDLTWFGKPYYLGDIPYKGRRGYTQGYFSISLSENNKFIILTGINPTQIKRKRGFFSGKSTKTNTESIIRSFSFWLLNENLEVVNHRKDFTIESKQGANLYMKRFKCDKIGNVFIVAENVKRYTGNTSANSTTGKKKKAATTGIENMSYSIFKLGIEEGDELEYETDNAIYLVDVNIGFSPDGKYVDAVGILYDQVTGIEVATGVHTMRLTKADFTEESSETTLFEPEFLKKINSAPIKANKKVLSKKRSSKTKKAAKAKIKFYENGITNLSNVNEVAYNSNGKVCAIMEKQWLEVITVTTVNVNAKTGAVSTQTTTYYVWHYGDVVMISGLGDADVEPVMDFIQKDDHSLIRYTTGIDVYTDQKDWFVFGKSELFKIDSETLSQTSYKISTKSSGGKAKMRASSTGYSNSIFTETFSLGDKEFVGIQLKSRKKMVVVRLKAN
jgi:hypothetical protein